jgi:hypothetical protein
MGTSLRMPRQWPQKVDYTDGSIMSDVVVVMAISWGHDGGKEWVSGAPGLVAPWRGQCPDRVVEARLGVG